ncbi:MAG: FAD binding domain-containing protein [Bacteroidetes bacterium]|nr:FAD binding domain-containing protein [Bacteroidota bacterium]
MIRTEKLYLKPNTANEAVNAALQHIESFRYIAGGTDAIVNKFQGNDFFDCIIDISQIRDLKDIKTDIDYLKIGALNTLDDLQKNEIIRSKFQAFAESLNAVASPVIRKSATIGGNLLCENRCSFYNQTEWWRESVGYCLKCDGDICIATGGKKNCFSKFVSDTAVALISLNAEIEFFDEDGEKTLPLNSIYTGDGVTPRNFKNTSLIKSVNLKINQNFKSVFYKLRQRESLEFSSLSTAVSIDENGIIRIVLGAVDPMPILVEGKIGDDINELINKAVKKARIVENDVYSRQYRKEMISVFLKRSFNKLGEKI